MNKMQQLAICERILENVATLANRVATMDEELSQQRQAFLRLLELYNEINDQLCNVSKSVANNIIATADTATPYGNSNAIGFQPKNINK
jgi:hypothetical protein